MFKTSSRDAPKEKSRDMPGDKTHRLALNPTKILEWDGWTDKNHQPATCAARYNAYLLSYRTRNDLAVT